MAPAATKPSAIIRPIPRDPPVTRATRPVEREKCLDHRAVLNCHCEAIVHGSRPMAKGRRRRPTRRQEAAAPKTWAPQLLPSRRPRLPCTQTSPPLIRRRGSATTKVVVAASFFEASSGVFRMSFDVVSANGEGSGKVTPVTLTHLQRLEAESIHIMREVVSEVEKPVMLYSVGKDSAVMLHLAAKAFYPSKPPFPAAARRHDLEVPGDVRDARAHGARTGLRPDRLQEPGGRGARGSIRSITARCTPTCGRPRG